MQEKADISAPLPGDSPFFRKRGPFSLADIKKEIGFFVDGCAYEEEFYEGIAPLQSAAPQHISFFDNRRYLSLLKNTQAGIVIISRNFQDMLPTTCQALVCDNPYLAWSRVARLFFPLPPSSGERHPSAVIGRDVHIGRNVAIGPFVTIEEGARIGDDCVIGAHAAIGPHVEIGEACRLGAHITVSHAALGKRVVLYPGARIGQDGFGFAVGEKGFENIPQLGRVILHDDVEVGANSTIDRGSMKDTVIGAGSRIDNLVQIGHNVILGRCCIVVAQAGISGSTELEDFVTIAAQAGLVGHIRIGQKARVAAQSGVISNVEAGADVMGSPSLPLREHLRNVAVLRKLSRKKRS